MLARASSGLYFVEDFLYRHSAKDGAYFRSLCILLSYSFELLLKSIFVITNEFKNEKALENQLIRLNHDLSKIARKLGTEKLNAVGIKNLYLRRSIDFVGYIVETTSGKEVAVEDFIDIRYDFTRDALRVLPEDEEFKGWVSETIQIYTKIKDLYFTD